MSSHYSVLKEEALTLLNLREGGVYVDGTLGRAGHSKEILKRLKDVKIYGFDLDLQALEEVKNEVNDSRLKLIHANYARMGEFLEDKVDGILIDLGVSSPQFDEGERGFSYRYDAPLDMRMNQEQSLSAKEVVNNYSEEQLAEIFWKYGEERLAKRIAREIVESRSKQEIATTFQLVDVIKKSLPAKELAKKGHPAKRCFQALRIYVNDELNSLQQLLNDFPNYLKVGGRIVIISFHSLEDRMVKQRFKQVTSVDDDKSIPLLPSEIPTADYRLLSKKAVVASEKELAENKRSHSAKLRAIERVK